MSETKNSSIVSSTVIKLLVILQFLMSLPARAQESYTLDIKEALSIANSSHYYFAGIVDRRHQKDNLGKIINEKGQTIPVVWNTASDITLNRYMNVITTIDTTRLPVFIALKKLSYSDNGSLNRHTLKLNLDISFYRLLDGKEVEIFQTSASPDFSVQGYVAGLCEKLMSESMTRIFRSFHEWIEEDPNQHILCLKAETIINFDPQLENPLIGDTIRWSSDYRLSWDDFKGKQDASSRFSAQSNCMFTFRAVPEYRKQVFYLNIYILPCFTRSSSWVHPEKKQDALLAHEQLHFDICEWYVRKLRAAIDSLNPGLMTADKEIHHLFEEYWNAYRAEQARYDVETEHGIVEEQQESWRKKVMEGLQSLEQFRTRSVR